MPSTPLLLSAALVLSAVCVPLNVRADSVAPSAAAVDVIDFRDMPDGAKLDAPWEERRSAGTPEATFYEGGKAGAIRSVCAGSMCLERPWPGTAQAVEVTLDCGDDVSDVGWGPGVAFTESGEPHRFVVRPASGFYELDGQRTGHFDRKKPVRLRIRLEKLNAICEATQEGEEFQLIGTVYGRAFPDTLRIGKVGIDGLGTSLGGDRRPVTCNIHRLQWTMGGARPASIAAIKPYPLLNPPPDITPAITRGAFGASVKPALPLKDRMPAERRAYEARVKWLHDAKYGIFFDYLSGGQWTPEEWSDWVDKVDVEKVADQAKAVGAGYVILTLGQNQIYCCAPNPVIAKYWGPQYCSKRDLPMDLWKALNKRGIALMLYFATDHQFQMPRPTALKGDERFDRWVEVAQWYSDHYGTTCKGWWVDGLAEFTKDYRVNIHNALKHGNPDSLVASGTYEISDFTHGHCTPYWGRQITAIKPFYGRWDPEYKIQWQVLQYIGGTWGAPGCNKKTEDVVKYAVDVVRGGGVFTFDLGTFTEGCFYALPGSCPTGKKPDGTRIGPFLEIQPDQFKVLEAVRDALQNVPVSDGSGQ